MIHIAVLLKPYIDFVLDGSKVIEARLTQDHRPPFDAIEVGQRIYFKQSAGPYRAVAVADHVLFEENLSPSRVRDLKETYNPSVRGDEAFWAQKESARFATLIWLREVCPTSNGPQIAPLQGRAWQILATEPAYRRYDEDDSGTGLNEFLIPLTEANLRNGTVSVARQLRRFDPRHFGGASRADAADPLSLHLFDGPALRSDIVRDKRIFRCRAWTRWWKRHDVRPGDAMVFRQAAGGVWEVGLVRRSMSVPGDPAANSCQSSVSGS